MYTVMDPETLGRLEKNLTYEELKVFSKAIAYVYGDSSIVMTDMDKKVACAALRKMIDSRADLSEGQKEEVKAIIEMCEKCGNVYRDRR